MTKDYFDKHHFSTSSSIVNVICCILKNHNKCEYLADRRIQRQLAVLLSLLCQHIEQLAREIPEKYSECNRAISNNSNWVQQLVRQISDPNQYHPEEKIATEELWQIANNVMAVICQYDFVTYHIE